MPLKPKRISDLASRVKELTAEVRLLNLAVYLLLIVLIFIAILMILALTYADSYDPMALFTTYDRTFSYSGNPLSARVDSNVSNYLWCDMIDNGSVFIYGQSRININPDSLVTLKSATGETRVLDGPLTVIGDGEADITTAFDDEGPIGYYNNTHLYFNQASVLFESRNENFNVILDAMAGDAKSYDDELIAVDGGDPLYSFLHFIRLKGDNFTVMTDNGSFPFSGTITYAGTVNALTPGEMWTYLPVNETQNLLAASQIYIANTDGSLVIGGKEYDCAGADNLIITSQSNSSSALMVKRGKVQAVGKVSSLNFRGQEYASQPIKVFMRDGYFTMVTGFLAAVLALLGRKVVEEVRGKKKEE